MPMTLAVASVAEQSAVLQFGGLAPDGSVDVQIGARRDFSFCVAPIMNIVRTAQLEFQALNQRATLYARCRARRSSGVVEPWSDVFGFRTLDGPARVVVPQGVMIEPALIVVPEPVLEWRSNAEVAGFPVSNLGRDAPVGWKVEDVDGELASIVQSRLSGAPIDTIAALNSNMPEAGQVSIFAASTREGLGSGIGRVTVAQSVPFRASANLPGRAGYHGLFRFAAVALPWWEVRFEGQKTGDTFWLEHLIFGMNRVTKNHSVDKSEAAFPRGSVERTRSGNPDRPDGLPMRRVEFDISMMTEAQFETAYADLHRHENEAVLVVPNSKKGAFLHDRILFGDLRGGRTINPFSPRFTRSFTIESLI